MPSFLSSSLISSTVFVLHSIDLWRVVIMMAFQTLSANMILLMVVTIGLVHGVIAATTPIGLATFVIPVSSSLSIIPLDFFPFRLFQIIFVFCLFFAFLAL